MYDYEALNVCIIKAMAQAGSGARLLAYALDTVFLPNEAYEGYPQYIGSQKEPLVALQHLKYVTQLFWVRAFFENGDGNNIWISFRERFDEATREKVKQHRLQKLAECLPEPFNDRREFLRHCWLVGGGEDDAGSTSNLWKFLTPLIRQLPSGDDIELDGILTTVLRHVDQITVPSYFSDLIEREDKTFLKSLRAMRNNSGEGWLTRVAPLWHRRASRADATANWMLFINGRTVRVDLVVDNIFVPDGHCSSLSIKQDGENIATCVLSPGQTRVHFMLANLDGSGFDVTQEITVHLGHNRVAQVSALSLLVDSKSPRFYRFPMNSCGSWLPEIDSEGCPSHVYGRRLAVLVPFGADRPDDFQLGGQSVQSRQLVEVSVAGQRAAIIELLFEELADNAPLPLTINGVILLYVGPKPTIDVVDCVPACRCLDPECEDATVLLANRAELKVRNVPPEQNRVHWECSNGVIVEQEKSVIVEPKEYGFPVKISYGNARKTLLFLPETAFCDSSEGWQWIPDNNLTIKVEFARRGEEVGTVFNTAIERRFARRLEKVIWWWERNIEQEPLFVNEKQDFDDHGKLAEYRFCYWVPDNCCSTLSLNEHSVLSITGPECDSKRILPYIEKHISVGQKIGEIDYLRLDRTEIAQIWRIPTRPKFVLDDGQPHVFFPEKKFDPSHYVIICCYESGLLSGATEWIDCSTMGTSKLEKVRVQHQRKNGEGVWLLLIKNTGSLNSSKEALVQDLALKHYHIEDSQKWLDPDVSYRLSNRIGVDQASEQADTVRGLLDMLFYTNNVLNRHGVFAEAVEARDTLAYQRKREYWDTFFREHCQLEDLDPVPRQRSRPTSQLKKHDEQSAPITRTLELMLRAGLNWCAEPDWFIFSYGCVLDVRNTRLQVPRRVIDGGLRTKLLHIYPAIFSMYAISKGFPVCEQNDYPCPLLNQALFTSPQDMLVLRCPGSAIPRFLDGARIDNLSKEGVFTLRNLGKHDVQFLYHGNNQIRAADGYQDFVVSLADGLDERLTNFMLNEDEGCGALLLSVSASEHMNQVFDHAMIVASNVLGTAESRSLGYIFTVITTALRESRQFNLAAVYQAAVVSRLHAWLGWKGATFPGCWPLSEGDVYDFVCSVICSSWMDTRYKLILQKDVANVEWMLAWFHRDKVLQEEQK